MGLYVPAVVTTERPELDEHDLAAELRQRQPLRVDPPLGSDVRGRDADGGAGMRDPHRKSQENHYGGNGGGDDVSGIHDTPPHSLRNRARKSEVPAPRSAVARARSGS